MRRRGCNKNAIVKHVAASYLYVGKQRYYGRDATSSVYWYTSIDGALSDPSPAQLKVYELINL